MAEEVKNKEVKSGSGLEPNVAAVLAYFFDFIGGLVFFLIEKEDKFVRFSAAQSLVLGVINLAIMWVVLPTIVGLTFGLGALFIPIYWLAYVALRVYLMVKAYNKEEVELPLIGKISRDFIK